MMVTLVDTNVLIDYLQEDPHWFDWSAAMLSEMGGSGPLAINQVVFGEVSMMYERIEDVNEALPVEYFTRAPLPWEAAFLAAQAFKRYRLSGGTRATPLRDFFIGAHAAVAGMALLTRDPRRYQAYFPKVRLIAP